MITSTRPEFEQFNLLMQRLEQMWADGKGESEEADKLRDEMDPLWWKLTGDERRWFNRNVVLPKLP